METSRSIFTQINLVVQNMEATLAFYRKLGLEIKAEPGDEHVAIKFPNGPLLEFDTVEFARQWDSGLKGATGGGVVIGFSVPSPEAVDELYSALTGAGHRGHQPPYDAFWGARYAIIEDPDGNSIGLMSPIENERKFWPPAPLPRGE